MTVNAMRAVGAVLLELPAFKLSASAGADAPAVLHRPAVEQHPVAQRVRAAGCMVVSSTADMDESWPAPGEGPAEIDAAVAW